MLCVSLSGKKTSGPADGFHAAASEHSPEGCVSQDGCRLCSLGAAGCPWLWCRAGSLLCPRGCVPGQGLCRLPGSALSLPGELPRALRGDVWGEGAPRQGRGLLLPQLLPGAGGSQLRCTPECFQGHSANGCPKFSDLSRKIRFIAFSKQLT